jgi:hypothetical protein
MFAMRRNPYRVDGRHDPLLLVDANRQQAAHRPQQLTASVMVRGRDARLHTVLCDGDKKSAA